MAFVNMRMMEKTAALYILMINLMTRRDNR
jgi:hypothetical protein